VLTLDSLIGNLDQIPPFPRNLVLLTELLEKPDVNVDQVVSLIEYDPALTALVMRLCNSAYFGASSPASDLHEATARLGFNEIFQLVTSLGAAALLRPQQKGYGIEAGELWRHSVTSALIGKCIALDRDDNPSLVFTACLLHDIGKVALSRSLEEQYDQVLVETRRSQTPMLVVEQQLLGFDHAEVGGRLLERWQFAPRLAAAVRYHHDPAAAGEHASLAAYAYLANMIACFMGFGCGYQALAFRCRAEALDLAGLSSEDIPRYMTKAFFALGDLQALLNIQFQP
jgi:putative nucleotidyltransferase with HDIG domain